MVNIVKHLFADMLNGDVQLANRSFAVGQDDKKAKQKSPVFLQGFIIYLTSRL
jgi:hypothetical protein